jgi:hypothetical protein
MLYHEALDKARDRVFHFSCKIMNSHEQISGKFDCYGAFVHAWQTCLHAA